MTLAAPARLHCAVAMRPRRSAPGPPRRLSAQTWRIEPTPAIVGQPGQGDVEFDPPRLPGGARLATSGESAAWNRAFTASSFLRCKVVGP